MMTQHYVSPSALSEFRRCRRCFWLDRNRKIKKPRGAFPTLPGGIDRILKVYFDRHRAVGMLPPELVGAVPAGTTLYPDMTRLTGMRDAWKHPTLTMMIGQVKLGGGIDDLLVAANGAVSPFDFKTKGAAISDNADPFEYYRMQLNDYGLLLQAAKFQLTGAGYLGYWSPMNVAVRTNTRPSNKTGMWMTCQVFSMDLDLEAARTEIVEAGACLDGPLPPSETTCDMCAFIALRSDSERGDE